MGARKGSEFERATCRALGRWVTNGKREDVFARVASSGGVFTTQLRKKGKGKGHPGDILAIRAEGLGLTDRFLIECKHWRNLGLGDFLLEFGECFEEMCKTISLSRAASKFWMYVIKQDHCPVLLLMSVSSFSVKPTFRHTTIFNGTVYLMRLKDVMENLSLEQFLAMTNSQPTYLKRVPILPKNSERSKDEFDKSSIAQ